MKFRKISWQKYCKIVVIIVSSAASLSMTSVDPYQLLSVNDHAKQISDREDHSALSSALEENPYWESFNEWRCFSTENIQALECSELDYGLIKVPTLRVQEGTELYDFSLDPEPPLSCETTLKEWSATLAQEKSFCIYSAYLQDLPSDSFPTAGINHWGLWILEKIKTNKGYWNWKPDDEEETSPEDTL